MESREVLGTRLRLLLDLLDDGVTTLYPALGLDGFRPRYTPVLRNLATEGPSSIRDLARAIGVTHSAASQTVAQLAKEDLVTLSPGADARQRIVHLTPKAESLLPAMAVEWAAVNTAVEELESELPYPLSRLVDETLEALRRRPMRDRTRSAAERLRPVTRQGKD
ncbi:MarR family winged helix-turn-helix transcriptional regulator [Nonomuraea sp. bgisy101]|uniref:MarR family winged helix-turn-helix transcriptional regulator n=1 Tax=Nonomuraea sp. bgisy101 TaxID=3413784 RepID=UPI003D747D07